MNKLTCTDELQFANKMILLLVFIDIYFRTSEGIPKTSVVEHTYFFH